MTSDNHVTGPVSDAMIEAERKYVRRLRDYRQWKITPHEIEDPEDAGRELEFAWGEAWELGWNAALAMKSKEQASALRGQLEAMQAEVDELRADKIELERVCKEQTEVIAELEDQVRASLSNTQGQEG